jgi:hypothetical protein
MMVVNMKVLILITSVLVMSALSKVNPGKAALNYLKKANKKTATRAWRQTKTRKSDYYGFTSPAPIAYGSPKPIPLYSDPSPSPTYAGPTPNPPYTGPTPSYDSSNNGNSDDPHAKEFCVDASTYQSVVWVERDGEECTTEFVQQCEQKSESVCADVTETFCEVSVWCKLPIMSIASVSAKVRYHYKVIRPYHGNIII